ncbi:MAG: hypothetical protein Tsb002_13110 [Wenzhouxiangellaceae bacterium]
MIYIINKLTIDTSARLLYRDGLPVSIPRRAFDCLSVLIEHRDRVIGRDELIQKIWGHCDISDNQLSQTILLVRRLLDDDGVKQRMIRTVSGIGYHWQGEVQIAPDSPELAPSNPPLEPESSANPTHIAATLTILDQADDIPAENDVSLPTSTTTVTDTNPKVQESLLQKLVSWPSIAKSITTLLILAAYYLISTDSMESTTNATAVHGSVWVLPTEIDDSQADSWVPVGLMSLISDSLRVNGFRVTPIESVLPVINSRRQQDQPLDTGFLQDRFNADIVIRSTARLDDETWTVRLTAERRALPAVEITQTDEQLIEAIVAAVDALLIRLEKVPYRPAGTASKTLTAMKEWYRQGNYARVHKELNQLSPQIRQQIETRFLEAQLADAEADYTHALDTLLEILNHPELHRKPVQHAMALLLQTEIERALDEPARLENIDKAITILRQQEAQVELASALLLGGRFMARLNQTEPAKQYLIEARTLFITLDDRVGAAQVNYELARMTYKQGHHYEALEQLAGIETVFEQYMHFDELAKVYQLRLIANIHLLRWREARVACDQGIRSLTRYNLPRRERLLMRCTTLYLETGEFMHASEFIDQIAIEQQQRGQSEKKAVLLDFYRTSLDLERGRFQDALNIIEPAAIRYMKLTNRLPRLEKQTIANREKSVLLYALARQATAATTPFEPVLHSVIDQPVSYYGHYAKALYLLESNRQDEAEESLNTALQHAYGQRALPYIIRITESLIQMQLRHGRVAAARSELNRLMADAPERMANDYRVALIILRVAQAEQDHKQWSKALRRAEMLAVERIIPAELTRFNNSVRL